MKMTVVQFQTKVYADKEKNIEVLTPLFEKAAEAGADLICLPEMFNCPYETPNFPVYAEKDGGPSWQALSALAKTQRTGIRKMNKVIKTMNKKARLRLYIFPFRMIIPTVKNLV